MEKIKFSIIVPVYKVEEYIRKCIDSLVNQTYSDIEIIIVDDGSPDMCPEICDEYAGKYEYVQAFHKKNGGLSDARNYGLKRAAGEYIIFVDSDDYIKLDACQKFNEIINNYGNKLDIIAANSKRIGDTRPRNEVYTFIEGTVSGRGFLKTQFKNETMYKTAWRNAYKREFLIKNKLFFKYGILHEDEQWTPRVFLKAETVLTTDYIFYYHNIRPDSITQQEVKTKNALDIVSTCEDLREVYDELEDIELKKLLLDNIVALYLHAFYIGKLLGNENRIDKVFLKENATSKENKHRVKFFLCNKYLYYYYYYLRRNYLSKSKVKGLIRKLLLQSGAAPNKSSR